MSKPKKSVIDTFIALPDAEKERIYQQLDAETPAQRLARSRPLNAAERRQWRGASRPRWVVPGSARVQRPSR